MLEVVIFSTSPTDSAMSLPSLPIPTEFPLPRAIHYQIAASATIPPSYTIHIVESWREHNTENNTDHIMGSYSQRFLFHELQDLYTEFNVQGGFVFPTESIAVRMKSMDRVLCWFGFRDDHKYTCYIQKDVPTSSPQ
jgi:hypothetical protein